MKLPTTPSQTVGPFFASGLCWADGPYVVPEGSAGGLWIRGQVLDGVGDPVPDALVELWQADQQGRFASSEASPQFRGFARCSTDEQGRFGAFTVKPGRVPLSSGRAQAPHVAVTLLARGLLNRLVTRVYFADEPTANAEDPVLGSLPDASRRATLLAAVASYGYRFDIHLQGVHETVFFDF